jgi:hypothetical protein
MLSKNRLKFLRGPIHRIPCHELNCNIVLHTRAYNKKYCQKHNNMAKMGRQHRKNVKKRQTEMQSPYGRFGNTTQKLCLKCGQTFGSISKFNKLCEPCNQDNETIMEQMNSVGNSSLNRNNYHQNNRSYGGAYYED